MRAVQYRAIGAGPEVVDVPTPEPGPGEVRLRVTAAGLCHSDWSLTDLPADAHVHGEPLTLGHEAAGVVDPLGEGVTTRLPGSARRAPPRGRRPAPGASR